ncbi:PT domain-containing protein [Leifsonia sp. YAF41]
MAPGHPHDSDQRFRQRFGRTRRDPNGLVPTRQPTRQLTRQPTRQPTRRLPRQLTR